MVVNIVNNVVVLRGSVFIYVIRIFVYNEERFNSIYFEFKFFVLII